MPRFVDRVRGSDVNQGDRDLIRMMLDGGEQLATRPRETTHYLHFQIAAAARVAADASKTAGFVVDTEEPGDERNDWQVQAKHTILVTEQTITAARRTLTPIAEAAGGYYDAWDTYADAALDERGD